MSRHKRLIINYNIYNVDQMAEKINRIKSNNINNNKLSLIQIVILNI